MYIVTFTDTTPPPHSPILQVILPSLHISLGVFKKLYDLFEGECHDLDSHLFKLRADAEVDSDEDDLEVNNFDAQVSASISKQHNISKQLQDKQARLEEIEDDLPLYVLQNTTQQDASAEFCQMAMEAVQLRIDVHEFGN